MGQGIVVARDLRNNGSHFRVEPEVAVHDEKAANTTKIDRSKKVFEIQIQYEAASLVRFGIGDDRPTLLEPVGNPPTVRLPCFNLVQTVT